MNELGDASEGHSNDNIEIMACIEVQLEFN